MKAITKVLLAPEAREMLMKKETRNKLISVGVGLAASATGIVIDRVLENKLIEEFAPLVETVTETDGRVRLAGETWSARVPDGAQPCMPGDEVRVVSIDGATAIVAKTP